MKEDNEKLLYDAIYMASHKKIDTQHQGRGEMQLFPASGESSVHPGLLFSLSQA